MTCERMLKSMGKFCKDSVNLALKKLNKMKPNRIT